MTINMQDLPGTLLPAGPPGGTGPQGPNGQQGEQGTSGPQGNPGPIGPAPYQTPIPFSAGINAVPGPPATAVIVDDEVWICTIANVTTNTFNAAFFQQIPSTIAGVNSINDLTGPVTLMSGSGGSVVSSSDAMTILEPGGWRNKFQNSHFDISAGTGTSGTVATGSTSYTLEGWQITTAGAAVAWSQQFNQNLSGNAIRLACATGLTTCTLRGRIESLFAVNLLNKIKAGVPVTIQFTIFNNTGATITPQLATFFPTTTRDLFTTLTDDLVVTNLQSCPNGVATTVCFTYTPNASIGLGFEIDLLFGSSLNATSGFVDISFADVRVTPQAVTGLNSNPPPYETRAFKDELEYCQRYFETSYNMGVAAGTASTTSSGWILAANIQTSGETTVTSMGIIIQFKTRKRPGTNVFTPFSSNSGASGDIFDVVNSVDRAVPTIQCTETAASFSGYPSLVNSINYNFQWTANNRL
jgi:hypothetical protein